MNITPAAKKTLLAAAAKLATSPPGTAEAVPAVEKPANKNRKKRKAEDTAREVRQLFFPTVQDKNLWLLNGERGGFAQVPRTVSLFSEVIIKQAVKLKTGVTSAAGSTYNVLWLHTQGQGISKIENEADAALEAGYGGERGVTTFRKHMRVLKDLGFAHRPSHRRLPSPSRSAPRSSSRS